MESLRLSRFIEQSRGSRLQAPDVTRYLIHCIRHQSGLGCIERSFTRNRFIASALKQMSLARRGARQQWSRSYLHAVARTWNLADVILHAVAVTRNQADVACTPWRSLGIKRMSPARGGGHPESSGCRLHAVAVTWNQAHVACTSWRSLGIKQMAFASRGGNLE